MVPRNDKELAGYYRSIDILIAPGTVQFGAFHYPVLEAMACGTPVIHTGYSPGESGNSWIIKPHSAKSIVDAVESLIAGATSDKTDRAIERVMEFSWDNMCARFERILIDFA